MSMPGPPTDRRRNDTKDRIVDAALALFAIGGYSSTSVADIERAVGLSPGAGGMYRHFPSKDAVLLASVQAYSHKVRELRGRLAVGAATGDAATDLRLVLEAFVELLSGEVSVARLALEGSRLPGEARDALGTALDDAYGAVSDLFVRHGMAAAHARPAAVLALGSLHHYAEQVAGWGRTPFAVPASVFVTAWIEQWSSVLTRHDETSTAVGYPGKVSSTGRRSPRGARRR